jgi:hydrogenase maturation protease
VIDSGKQVTVEAEERTAGGLRTRVLCLGNELLSDDAFGILVGKQLDRLALPGVEVVCTAATGFHLLDYILDTSRLLVIDTICSGAAEPGTLHTFDPVEMPTAPGCSPHYVGLFEVLTVGKKLGLAVPDEVAILAVEPADCSTIGGTLHPAVRQAVPVLVNAALEWISAAERNGSLSPQKT